MANGIADAIFSALATQRPEFKNAMKIWTDVLEPTLAARESERVAIIRKARSRTLWTGLVVGGIALLILALTRGSAAFFTLFGAVAVTGIASAASWVPLFGVKSQTKQLVVGAAAESFGFKYDTLHPDVSGVSSWQSAGAWLKSQASGSGAAAHILGGGGSDTPAPTPAFNILKEARLLPSYDDRKFEDLIEGDRADAHFSLVECKLTEERGSGKNRRTVTTFQGLLFHIEYPQRFLGRTLIARQGWWKGFFGDKSLQKVDLVAKELEDNFTIYSNDQVEARALLTPDRMERLIALERHFKGGKLRGIFEGDHLTLALEADNQFEAGSVWKPLVDPDRYVSALTEIGLVCDVIDGFLTREWVKDKL
ncbi:MAG: DUF3137 domain-containing protein [Pseudomonadota bacterium]